MADGDALTVMIGRWQIASMMSRSRLLPHRFSGARMTSRAAVFQAGAA